MLTKRIIPCLDVKDGRVVKGVHFVGLRDAGDPAELARRYDEEGADEITLLDITATTDGRRAIIDVPTIAIAAVTLLLVTRLRARYEPLVIVGAGLVGLAWSGRLP